MSISLAVGSPEDDNSNTIHFTRSMLKGGNRSIMIYLVGTFSRYSILGVVPIILGGHAYPAWISTPDSTVTVRFKQAKMSSRTITLDPGRGPSKYRWIYIFAES
jgi:hypothetical protein